LKNKGKYDIFGGILVKIDKKTEKANILALFYYTY
jgi:hypothetical protein